MSVFNSPDTVTVPANSRKLDLASTVIALVRLQVVSEAEDMRESVVAACPEVASRATSREGKGAQLLPKTVPVKVQST